MNMVLSSFIFYLPTRRVLLKKPAPYSKLPCLNLTRTHNRVLHIPVEPLVSA